MGAYTLAHLIWTVLLLVIFICIIFWAWSGRQKRRFDEASRLPLEDESYKSPLAPGGRGAGERGTKDDHRSGKTNDG